MTLLFVLFER